MSEIMNTDFSFNLRPEKAINYIDSEKYIIISNWQDLWRNDKVFNDEDIIDDISNELKDALKKKLEEGNTFYDFKKYIKPIIEAKGCNLSDWRLEFIYQTNVGIAHSVGRYEEQESIKDFMPYWQYTAIMDMKTRPEHAALNGKVFKADDPFWNFFYPPNGFNCRCRVVTYTQQQFARKGLKLESTNNGAEIETVQVEVGRGNNKKLVETKSYKGNKVDTGWDYNPGEEFIRTKIAKIYL